MIGFCFYFAILIDVLAQIRVLEGDKHIHCEGSHTGIPMNFFPMKVYQNYIDLKAKVPMLVDGALYDSNTVDYAFDEGDAEVNFSYGGTDDVTENLGFAQQELISVI